MNLEAPPGFEPGMASNLTRTTQTLSYRWTNTSGLADMNQPGQITSGEAVLTIHDGANAQVYSRDLKNTGTFITSSGAAGSSQRRHREEHRLRVQTGIVEMNELTG